MNMVIIGPIIMSFISGFSTLLGLIVLYINISREEKSTVFFLSISSSMMIIISIFELIPNSLNNILNIYIFPYNIIISVLIFLLGYNFTVFIDKFLSNNNSNLYKIGIKNTLILIIHNLLEGVVIFASSLANMKVGIKLLLATIIHNISEGISIALPINNGIGDKKKAIFYTFLASIFEPIGALLSYIIFKGNVNINIMSFILLFVSGIMISISINDILKEIISYKKYKYIIYGYIISILIYLIVL